jgi:hypothetical protein
LPVDKLSSVIVQGYHFKEDEPRRIKAAKVSLQNDMGRTINFVHKGDGEYMPEESIDLDKKSPFTLKISHEGGDRRKYYKDREINFLEYPFHQSFGSAFIFYLFPVLDKEDIDRSYNQRGSNKFCERSSCNAVFDKAVSYYELSKEHLDEISGDLKKQILYNLGRSQFYAWWNLYYDTCNTSYKYFREAYSLVKDGNTDVDDEIMRYLGIEEFPYFWSSEQQGKTVKSEAEFCQEIPDNDGTTH